MKDSELAGQFLGYFLERAEPGPYQKEQLLAIMTQRAIGMHFDAFNDAPQGQDYTNRAKRLLALCLTRDLTSLL